MEKLNVSLVLRDTRGKLTGKKAHRLAALHTAVAAAVTLAVPLLQYLLQIWMGRISGLSGLSALSILETLQMLLQSASALLLPFWELGFFYAAIQWARGNPAQRKDLLEGFHRFGACLGMMLCRILLVVSVLVISFHISSFLYLLTPAAASLTRLAGTAGDDAEALAQLFNGMESEQLLALGSALLPLLLIWAGLSAVLLIPLMYRFRMAQYVVLESRRAGGWAAMLMSAALMRRRRWQLFRLDLRFWWYYALKALCLCLCYGDLLLSLAGVELPAGGFDASLLTYGLYLAGLFAVETTFRPQVETAYAAVYGAIMEKGPVSGKTPEKARKVPWEE